MKRTQKSNIKCAYCTRAERSVILGKITCGLSGEECDLDDWCEEGIFGRDVIPSGPLSREEKIADGIVVLVFLLVIGLLISLVVCAAIGVVH